MRRTRASIAVLILAAASGLSAQRIVDISYSTAEGNRVVLEKTWATAFVSQGTEIGENPDGPGRTVEFKLAWAAKLSAVSGEIVLKGPGGAEVARLSPDAPASVPAGTYDADIGIDFGAFGKVKFSAAGVEIKEPPAEPRADKDGKTVYPVARAVVRLSFNLPLVRIERVADKLGGQAYYEAITYWALDRKEGNYIGYAKLFPPGEKDPKKAIQKKEGADRWGKAPPGVYDFLVDADIGFAGRAYDVRILGARLEPEQRYKLHLVMNGALVTVVAPKAPHAIHFYRPGTAAKNPKPARDAKAEAFTSEAPRQKIPCPPGTYDVLYNFDWGGRYEWRPDVRFDVGSVVGLP
jgi:hypothetical protein